MNNQTLKNDQDNSGETKKTNLINQIRSSWLEWRDSNPKNNPPNFTTTKRSWFRYTEYRYGGRNEATGRRRGRFDAG